MGRSASEHAAREDEAPHGRKPGSVRRWRRREGVRGATHRWCSPPSDVVLVVRRLPRRRRSWSRSRLTLAGVGVVVAVAATRVERAARRSTRFRWQDGTMTLRTVEPGAVGEYGQRVVCEVELNPPPRLARVATTVGPMDTRVAGGRGDDELPNRPQRVFDRCCARSPTTLQAAYSTSGGNSGWSINR